MKTKNTPGWQSNNHLNSLHTVHLNSLHTVIKIQLTVHTNQVWILELGVDLEKLYNIRGIWGRDFPNRFSQSFDHRT